MGHPRLAVFVATSSLLAVGVVLFARARRSDPPTGTTRPAELFDTSSDEVLRLRDDARALLARNCGECHTRGSSVALRGALRVFDLDETEWSAHMTIAQLRDAERRLRDDIVPTPGPEEVKKIAASPDELDRFARYVANTARARASTAP